MSVNRWLSDILEMLNWLEGGEEELNDFLFQPTFTRVLSRRDEEGIDSIEDQIERIPDQRPILPLRGVVVYPHTGVPLTIGQPRSIKLVDDVVAGNRLVGLVASKDPDLETPGPDDLYKVGTVATVHKLFRAPDETIRLLVQGTHRFKLGEFIEETRVTPELIVGVPVGFVGAAESKEYLRGLNVPSISTIGTQGGSNVAAAIMNAIIYMAVGRA